MTAVQDGAGGDPGVDVRQDFVATMAHLPSLVTVVATSGPAGPVGCTVSAVLSLSLDPPSLLLSFGIASRTAQEILRTGGFAVNALSADQAELARSFATAAAAHRFGGVEYRLRHGQPVLEHVASTVVCSVTRTVQFGDHVLVAGEALWSAFDAGRMPLIRRCRAYVPATRT